MNAVAPRASFNERKARMPGLGVDFVASQALSCPLFIPSSGCKKWRLIDGAPVRGEVRDAVDVIATAIAIAITVSMAAVGQRPDRDGAALGTSTAMAKESERSSPNDHKT